MKQYTMDQRYTLLAEWKQSGNSINQFCRDNGQKSYMWLARGVPPGQPAVYYEYHPTRTSEHAKNFLTDFDGYLQTDGYQRYKTAVEENPDISLFGC